MNLSMNATTAIQIVNLKYNYHKIRDIRNIKARLN